MRAERTFRFCCEYHRKLVGKSDLSREARSRLKWFDHFAKFNNISLTCRYFGISRETFYRWKKRFNPRNLSTLENRSCWPLHVRIPTWTRAEIQAVAKIRQEFPRWGKEKLHRLLRRYKGVAIAVSRIGRILKNLKDNGKLIEGTRCLKARNARKKRPYARRKPREYVAKIPGDIVQIDTLEVRPVPGTRWFQYTARDMVSRWDVLHVATTNSSGNARDALKALLQRAPFEVRAIQVDGGAEYRKHFEEAAERLGIRMFVLPPRSPNLNAHVERAQRTHTEEFYETRLENYDDIESVRHELADWEYIYNNIRPHHSLDYQTPAEYIERFQKAS